MFAGLWNFLYLCKVLLRTEQSGGVTLYYNNVYLKNL